MIIRCQSIAAITVFSFGWAFVSTAWADPASDACAALVDTRNALYSMLSANDKPAQDALNAKLQAASTKVDSALAGMTGADAKLAADFKAVWDQFKATREKEIIPAIYDGNTAEAKRITDGIQYERLSKMWRSCLVGELPRRAKSAGDFVCLAHLVRYTIRPWSGVIST